MGVVNAYLKTFVAGLKQPTHGWLFSSDSPNVEIAMQFGSNHGRWLGRWLHGIPTRAMIYKLFVVLAGILLGFGFVCWDIYYRPITGLFIGTVGLLMFATWGISQADLEDKK